MQFPFDLDWAAFDSAWYWAVLVCLWYWNMLSIGGIPSDVVDMAGDDPTAFEQFAALHYNRAKAPVPLVMVGLAFAIVTGLAWLALAHRIELAAALLLLILPQIYVAGRNLKLARRKPFDPKPYRQDRTLRLAVFALTVLIGLILRATL